MRRRQFFSSLILALVVAASACTQNVRAAVTLRLQRTPSTPPDAIVMIDEQFIGPLAYVAAHGVRLPVGEHRITVQKEGYFPWDRLVEADRQPIRLDVRLIPIPD
jgi:hypothetical protein